MDELEVLPAKKRFSSASDAHIASACNAKVPEATKTATCFRLKMFKSLLRRKRCCYRLGHVFAVQTGQYSVPFLLGSEE